MSDLLLKPEKFGNVSELVAGLLDAHSLFAISRISGWYAQRLEEMISGRRIIRPAYKTVEPSGSYIPIEER